MRRGLGLGFGRRRIAGQRTFSSEASAYFDAMSVPPPLARKMLINALIAGLVVDGIWDELDWFSLFASHDAQSARLNAVNPAQAFSVVGADTSFVVDQGYRGGAGSYLNSSWNPTDDGVNFALNSAHLAVFVNQDNGSTNQVVGADTASIAPKATTTNAFVVRANTAGGTTGPVQTHLTGFSAWDRSASNALQLFREGAPIFTSSAASTGLSASDFYAAGFNNGGALVATSCREAAVCWGAHLTDAQHLTLYGRLNTYLAAIGAFDV